MAHFAEIDQFGTVLRVIVAEPEILPVLGGTWVQTSYNTRAGIHYDATTGLASADQSKALRKNFAGIGFTYDAGRDAFISPKPEGQWRLDEATCQWVEDS